MKNSRLDLMYRQKGLASLLIILLMVLGISGYLIYSGKIIIHKSQSTVPYDIYKKTNINPDSTSSTETANWKIYQNIKMGFELKYPPYYQIDRESDDEISFSGSYYPGNQKTTDVVITSKVTDLSKLKECSNDNSTDPCFSNKKDIELAGKKAVSFELRYGGGGFGFSYRAQTVVPKLEIYKVVYGGGDSKGLLDQILSTFKFIQ